MQSPVIALIAPPPEYASGKHASLGGSEHLGIGYLAAALNQVGFKSHVLNYEDFYIEAIQAVDIVLSLCRILIGLSPTSYSINWTIDFCKHLKENCEIPIILGGHLATHMGKNLLDKLPEVDIICLGDGEETIIKVARCICSEGNLDNVDGIAYRDFKGGASVTRDKEILSDVDALPWPVHQLNESTHTARIVTSRGCPYNCNFCTTPFFYGRRVRYRDIDDVVSEMIYLNKEYKISRFFFSDDSFLDNSPKSLKRIERFTQLIGDKLPNIEFRCEVRADVVANNIKLIQSLFDIGMKYAFVGIESSIDSDLLTYNKLIDSSIIKAVPKILHDIGISVVPGFIMFNENSRLEDLLSKANFLQDNNYLYRTTLLARTCIGYPGSLMHKEMIECGSYDPERSNDYLLYPLFKHQGIRALSIAFQQVELLYSDLDAFLLKKIIYDYEEVALRGKNNSNNINAASEIFGCIQNIYYSLFACAIEFAKNESENVAIQHIVAEFSLKKESVEVLSNNLSSELTALKVKDFIS